ncbi:MAG: outer membrane lipoprotein chaperone LolA [Wenzhouxiangellaceae bacterium]|nr:outer membrane lipoprotein chaperone LolA [Wenzhouxiangellaceae bacterium]
MLRRSASMLLAAVLLAGLAAAEPEPGSVSAEDARAALETFAEDLTSLQAKFRQITVNAGGEAVEESHGRMWFQAPDRFRWDYLEPFPQLIVGDGAQLWHYDEALEQVTVRPQPAADESPMFVLLRPELLDRFYRIVPSGEPDRLRFEPLAEQAEIQLARLNFRDGQPTSLDIFDAFGQSTRLELEDLIRNPELDPALFEFTPPPGVDVLEGL